MKTEALAAHLEQAMSLRGVKSDGPHDRGLTQILVRQHALPALGCLGPVGAFQVVHTRDATLVKHVFSDYDVHRKVGGHVGRPVCASRSVRSHTNMEKAEDLR